MIAHSRDFTQPFSDYLDQTQPQRNWEDSEFAEILLGFFNTIPHAPHTGFVIHGPACAFRTEVVEIAEHWAAAANLPVVVGQLFGLDYDELVAIHPDDDRVDWMKRRAQQQMH